MTDNNIHRGEVVEKIIRRSGYSLTKLAEKLGISRNTLYNKFEREDLDYQFIAEVGNFIYYDFSHDFPAIKEEIELRGSSFGEGKEAAMWRVEGKYTHLLEKYTKLLAILAKAANDNELPSLREEINQFIDQEVPVKDKA